MLAQYASHGMLSVVSRATGLFCIYFIESSICIINLAGSPSLGFVPAQASPGLGYAPGTPHSFAAGSPYNSYAPAPGAMPSFSLDASMPSHEMTKVRVDAYSPDVQ